MYYFVKLKHDCMTEINTSAEGVVVAVAEHCHVVDVERSTVGHLYRSTGCLAVGVVQHIDCA